MLSAGERVPFAAASTANRDREGSQRAGEPLALSLSHTHTQREIRPPDLFTRATLRVRCKGNLGNERTKLLQRKIAQISKAACCQRLLSRRYATVCARQLSRLPTPAPVRFRRRRLIVEHAAIIIAGFVVNERSLAPISFSSCGNFN